uniref:phospholipase D-like domain-containing protein n=1 Tax=Burkholderia cepacia TaxID=292 RepID=UPI002ABE41E9
CARATRLIRKTHVRHASPPIVRLLLAAKRRGVDVAVVADRKGNVGRANIAALNLLVQAGIPTRLIDRYAIAQDKVIVVDGTTVETGSFNYSAAAARRNSENVVVMSGCPAIARQYLAHWQSR